LSSPATAIAGHFAVEGRLVSLDPQPGGHINESWLAVWEGPEGRRRFLLQHVNRHVFRQPEKVMENMVRLTRHVAGHLERESAPQPERRVLRLVPTRDGASHHRDPDGEVWRLLVWIEGTRSTESAETPAEARAAARAFGRFLRQIQDLPGPPLHETIPAFHDTPGRLDALERAAAADRVGRLDGVEAEVEAILDRRPLGHALAEGIARGELKLRTNHNDAKISNVLFDEESGEPLCVVDLDTVMPGLALHDFGDLVRSGGSDSAEDERDLEHVAIRVPVFEALARGFAEGASDALSPRERSLFPTAAAVITLEQAARFLTDHLDGDRYYRIDRPRHNLDRARTQIRLVESLEAHDAELRRIVESLQAPTG
jgi:Ser/Thr protein kinase RdoA (MazF antagonist)